MDSNDESKVRPALVPLNPLADDLGCIIVGVRHLSEKDAPHGVLAALLGSSAWAQVPRVVLGLVEDDEDDDLRHITLRALSGLHESRTWAEIQEIQARAHFCIVSSRGEGTCLTALEPLSRGVPLVGTAVGDIGRHLGNELARFVSRPDDPQALAAAISDLCEHYDDLAPVFARNGERLVRLHRDGRDSLARLAAEVVANRGSGTSAG